MFRANKYKIERRIVVTVKRTYESCNECLSGILLDYQSKSPELYNVMLNRMNGKTLKEVGEIHQRSHEWVRKIEIAFENDIQPSLQDCLTDIYALPLERQSLSKTDFNDFFSKDVLLFLDYYAKDLEDSLNLENSLFKDSQMGRVFFSKESVRYYQKIFKQTTKLILKDLQTELTDKQEVTSALTVQMIRNNIKLTRTEKDFYYKKICADVIAKKEPIKEFLWSREKQFSFLQEKYFPQGINAKDPYDLQLFRQTFNKHFLSDSPLPENDSLRTILSRHLYLWESLTYVSAKKFKTSKTFDDNLLEILSNNEHDLYYYQDLYRLLEKNIKNETNFDSANQLHGYLSVLKQESKIDWSLKRGYMTKEADYTTHSYYMDLANKVKEYDEPINLEQLLPIKDSTVLLYARMYCPNICFVGTNIVIHESHLSLSEEKKKILMESIVEQTNNLIHYTSIYRLRNKILALTDNKTHSWLKEPKAMKCLVHLNMKDKMKDYFFEDMHIVYDPEQQKNTFTIAMLQEKINIAYQLKGKKRELSQKTNYFYPK